MVSPPPCLADFTLSKSKAYDNRNGLEKAQPEVESAKKHRRENSAVL